MNLPIIEHTVAVFSSLKHHESLGIYLNIQGNEVLLLRLGGGIDVLFYALPRLAMS